MLSLAKTSHSTRQCSAHINFLFFLWSFCQSCSTTACEIFSDKQERNVHKSPLWLFGWVWHINVCNVKYYKEAAKLHLTHNSINSPSSSAQLLSLLPYLYIFGWFYTDVYSQLSSRLNIIPILQIPQSRWRTTNSQAFYSNPSMLSQLFLRYSASEFTRSSSSSSRKVFSLKMSTLNTGRIVALV